jgi:hypothetical protein
MSTELICPDCGGVVGATETTEAGPPCRCFTPDAKSTATATVNGASNGGSASGSGASAHEIHHPADAKVCRVCGRDITHSPRYKDSSGYMCHACHVIDKEKAKPVGVKCKDCGRVVLESALIDFQGVKVCFKCHEDRVEKAAHDKKYGTVSNQNFQQYDKRTVLIIGGIIGLLGLLILLHHFKAI